MKLPKKYVKLPDDTITLDSNFAGFNLQKNIYKVLDSLNYNLFATEDRIKKRGGTIDSLLKIIQEKVDKVFPSELKVNWDIRIDSVEKQEASEELSKHKDKSLTDKIIYMCCPIESSKYELDKCYVLVKLYPWWTLDGFGTKEFSDKLYNCGYKNYVPQYTEIYVICKTNTDMRINPEARNYQWL